MAAGLAPGPGLAGQDDERTKSADSVEKLFFGRSSQFAAPLSRQYKKDVGDQ
jgi:hypothetical protein